MKMKRRRITSCRSSKEWKMSMNFQSSCYPEGTIQNMVPLWYPFGYYFNPQPYEHYTQTRLPCFSRDCNHDSTSLCDAHGDIPNGWSHQTFPYVFHCGITLSYLHQRNPQEVTALGCGNVGDQTILYNMVPYSYVTFPQGKSAMYCGESR